MCLIVLARDAHPDYRLVVAANRDEFFDRPTERAGFWDDHPAVLAGRDLEGGGTWLGITLGGRFAAVTNFRDDVPPPQGARSRGDLVREFLIGEDPPREFLVQRREALDRYDGLSLIVGDLSGLWFVSNRDPEIVEIEPGLHGLSNHLLDTAWPKVERARQGLGEALEGDPDAIAGSLFEMLADRGPAPETKLPDTGVGPERERALSPVFVRTPGYGTRSSTILLVGRDGQVRFRERSFSPDGDVAATAEYHFTLDPAR